MTLLSVSRGAFVQRKNFQRLELSSRFLSSLFQNAGNPNGQQHAQHEQQQHPVHPLLLRIETPEDMHDLGALLSQITSKRGDVLLLDGDLIKQNEQSTKQTITAGVL